MRAPKYLSAAVFSLAFISLQFGAPAALADDDAAKAPLQGNIVKEHKGKKEKAAPGPEKHIGALRIPLKSGARLLARPDDVVMETPFGDVKVDGDSVVMILVDAKSLSVFDLHDPHKNAVVINSKAGPLPLHPAFASVIADKALKSFDDVNPAPVVPYRSLVTKTLDADHQVFQADFDVMHMVHYVPGISKLIDSPDPKVKDLMADMLKTTAINLSTRQSNEPYQYYMTAEVRALMSKSLAGKDPKAKAN